MIDKVYEVIDEIEKYANNIEFRKLKKDIISSNSFNLIKEYKKEIKKSNNLILAKKKLYDDDKINAYLKFQNEINMLELYINKNIKDITRNSHSC